MAEIRDKLPDNVPGKFYVDRQCIDCDVCRDTSPANFARNDHTVGTRIVRRGPHGLPGRSDRGRRRGRFPFYSFSARGLKIESSIDWLCFTDVSFVTMLPLLTDVFTVTNGIFTPSTSR